MCLQLLHCRRTVTLPLLLPLMLLLLVKVVADPAAVDQQLLLSPRLPQVLRVLLL
jgi:hypothetical protein